MPRVAVYISKAGRHLEDEARRVAEKQWPGVDITYLSAEHFNPKSYDREEVVGVVCCAGRHGAIKDVYEIAGFPVQTYAWDDVDPRSWGRIRRPASDGPDHEMVRAVADATVEHQTAMLATVTSQQFVRAVLQAEKDGKNRASSIKAITERLTYLEDGGRG